MEDYTKEYQECLNGTYQNESIEPVLNVLYKVVKYYDLSIKHSASYYSHFLGIDNSESVTNENISAFIKGLIKIATYLVNNNQYQDFSDVIDYLCKTKTTWNELISSLYAIYLPSNSYELNKDKYFDKFTDFVSKTIYINFKNNAYDFNLIKYLEAYRDYLDAIPVIETFYSRIIFFKNFGPLVLSIFYKDNIEIEELKKVFNYMLENYTILDTFFKVNSDGKNNEKLKQYLVEMILHDYSNKHFNIIKD